MSFDEKCYTLAAEFIADTDYHPDEAMTYELAQRIQDAIENFLQENGL